MVIMQVKQNPPTKRDRVLAALRFSLENTIKHKVNMQNINGNIILFKLNVKNLFLYILSHLYNSIIRFEKYVTSLISYLFNHN